MGKKALLVSQHALVPKHEKISDKDKKELFAKHVISFAQLPKIRLGDAALAELEVEDGDVVKITRISPTAGEAVFYRGIINE